MDQINNGLVALIGVLIVFLGLVALVGVCYLLGIFFGKKKEEVKTPAPKASAGGDDIDHDTLVSIISAAVSEYNGGNVSGLRIHSIKKL